MKEVVFPKEYFQDEVREGFFVERLMKHAWAAQLVVLKEIDDICNKIGVQWFADYGTILGAIRHKGFIPWDDDIDISMMRADYEKFIKLAPKEFPKGFKMLTIHNTPEYDDYMCRIVNHDHISVDPEIMDKYYNCPFALGIDLTPIDYIPVEPQEHENFKAMIEATATGANVYENDEVSDEEKKAMIARIEKTFKVKIHRGRPIPQQLRELADRIMGMYGPSDSKYIGGALRQTTKDNYWVEASCVDEIIEVPFETTTMHVPKGYDAYLKMRFGENYMDPVRYENHNYPFYKEQRQILDDWLAGKGE